MTPEIKIKLLDGLGQLSLAMAGLASRTFCPTGQGGGIDPTCGSGGSSGSGSSGGYFDVAKNPDMADAGLSVSSSGQIKIKKPKTAAESIKQLKAMSSLLDGAMRDWEKFKDKPPSKERTDAAFMLDHSRRQMARVMGFGQKLAKTKKSDETDLADLIAELSNKYDIQPDEDY